MGSLFHVQLFQYYKKLCNNGTYIHYWLHILLIIVKIIQVIVENFPYNFFAKHQANLLPCFVFRYGNKVRGIDLVRPKLLGCGLGDPRNTAVLLAAREGVYLTEIGTTQLHLLQILQSLHLLLHLVSLLLPELDLDLSDVEQLEHYLPELVVIRVVHGLHVGHHGRELEGLQVVRAFYLYDFIYHFKRLF